MLAGRRLFGQGVSLDPIKNLRKFVDLLPLPGGAPGTALSLATPDKTRYNQAGAQADFYQIVMGQYRWQFHQDLPSTKVWGYADATHGIPRWGYLGATIVAMRDTPVRVDFVNLLPNIHPLPVDTSIPGAETGQHVNRAAVHLHGGFVPWPSDGGPFHWFTPGSLQHGPSYVRWLPNRLGLLTTDNWYPNAQSARLMWYHDHAVGITRLNAYAGLAAGYVLIDQEELGMFGSGGSVLPDQVPGIPLILQEKAFKSVSDQWGRRGDLDYPTLADVAVPGLPPPDISCVPEFFGDTAIVNGKAFPQLTLDPGIYRFRMLNATQSRVWNLQLYADNDHDGDIEPGHVLDPAGPAFIQIGTEGGFLPKPVRVPSGNPMVLGPDGNVPAYEAHDYEHGYSLVLGGAERADVLIDFSDCPGTDFILYNDAPAPFDSGDPANDYRTGTPETPDPHCGPNTRTLMRITITNGQRQGPTWSEVRAGLENAFANMETKLKLIVPDDVVTSAPGEVPPGAVQRVQRIKTLNEGWDEFGRLKQMLGTATANGASNTVYGMNYLDAIQDDEKVQRGTQEVWDIYNTTGDVHPIHFHLVNVQILGRARFAQDLDGNPIGGTFTPIGPWIAPDPNERGYKETVRMNPGEVTRVIMQFDLPPDPKVNVLGRNRTVRVPTSPRTGGLEYVVHCHILEHEEHDMMRPLVVL
jgi:spore coat protein A, manganese oxidase